MNMNNASWTKLRAVHPDLVRVVKRCAADWKDDETGFIVTCGARSIEEQKVLVAKGASKTMNSRHIPGKDGYSKAVDLAYTIKGVPKWDWPLYDKMAKAMMAAAKAEKVQIEWGGSWTKFKDGPHFQLPKSTYP